MPAVTVIAPKDSTISPDDPPIADDVRSAAPGESFAARQACGSDDIETAHGPWAAYDNVKATRDDATAEHDGTDMGHNGSEAARDEAKARPDSLESALEGWETVRSTW
ncbi:hypothetical protein [Thermomonospora umbrina]|uniref:hypothetical protein n=1 Tax=Thermomonospora umbrina TaxID=111806 RepID=UPI0011C192E3|nr:hypothetical protein [Thermomonospora umbrina]